MTILHLHGHLADKYGGPFDWNFQEPHQAIKLLMVNFDDFRQTMEDGYYRIVCKHSDSEVDLELRELTFSIGKGELHLIPSLEGSGSGKSAGTVKLVIGVAIIAVALVASGGALGGLLPGVLGGTMTAGVVSGGLGLTYGSMALFGLAVALSGVATMLAPSPKAQRTESTTKTDSFLLEGDLNSTRQGGGIPIIYGRCRVGSTLVGSSYDVVQIQSGSSSVASGSNNTMGSTAGGGSYGYSADGNYGDQVLYTTTSIPPGGLSTPLYLLASPVDTMAGFFKVWDISGGSLFLQDGTTGVSDGQVITVAQGYGLRYRDSWDGAAAAYREEREIFTVQSFTDAGGTQAVGRPVRVRIVREGYYDDAYIASQGN